MQRLQAFKYELMPSGEQARDMRRFAGSCRFVYNKALALQKANYEAGGKFVGYVAMAKHLTEWRNGSETPWLKDAPVHPLQHALKDLERAYKNFFAKRAMFPRFKRKGQSESFRYPDAKQFEIDQVNGRIKLPKLGWIRYRNSRDILGAAKNITMSMMGMIIMTRCCEGSMALGVIFCMANIDAPMRTGVMKSGSFCERSAIQRNGAPRSSIDTVSTR